MEESADGGWSRTELVDHVRLEFSTYDWVIEAMFDRAGFQVLDKELSESAVFARYTCRRLD